MDDSKARFNSIDEYIASFPENIQAILEAIRATIRAAAPDAEEKISYQMPAFALKGNLVYFAAWKQHIGFYSGSGAARDAFAEELSGYEVSKGTIKFPFDKPIPHALISKIVEFRVAENLKKAASKTKKPKL